MLRRVGIPRARNVLIMTGDDAVNLAILHRVVECSGDGDRETTNVVVRLDNRSLARQLDRQDEFVRRRHVEVIPFQADAVAAQQFLAAHPLVDLADLRAQKRVHVVVIGWTGFALEVMEQIARLSPFRHFEIPRIDLFVPRPHDVRSELAAVQPAFLPGLTVERNASKQSDAAASAGESPAILEIHLHDLDGETGLPTNDQLAAIESERRPSVTAVVVTLGSDAISAAAALALRERCSIEGRWQAPIFVRMTLESDLTSLLQKRAEVPDPADRVIAVGTLARICDLESLLGQREVEAKALHASYVTSKGVADRPADERAENDQPWHLLKQTYRRANRRAIDHLAIKLLSAGYFVSGYPLRTEGEILGVPAGELQAVAALEHRSWEIDRLLDGWRPGTIRDNRRRINEAIGIPYDVLDEMLRKEVRRYDEDQVRIASKMLAAPAGSEVTVKREVRIGLLGDDFVSDAGLDRMVASLVSKLTPIIVKHQTDFISIMTPLAPGADLILTQWLVKELTSRGVPHRLVVVRTVPMEVLIDSFWPNVARGGRWNLSRSPLPGEERRARAAVQMHLDAMVRGNDVNSVRERHRQADRNTPGNGPAAMPVVANLVPVESMMADWQDPSFRESALSQANAYLALRCDMIVAFVDTTDALTHAHAAAPGATAQALEWVRNPAAIPAAYVVPRARATVDGPQLVVVP